MLGKVPREEGEARISLRPLQKQDMQRIKRWGRNQTPLLSGYNYGEMSFSESLFWYRAKTSKNARYFAIDHNDQKMIGYLGAKQINMVQQSALLGIVLDPNFQSQGYGKEALLLFMDFYFNEWGMRSLNLEVNQFNKRALALYEDLGFRYVSESYEKFENQEINVDALDDELKESFFYRDGTLYSKLWVMRKESL